MIQYAREKLVCFAKYGLHLPLNRQSDVHQREGIDIESTQADWAGPPTATLMPLVDAIRGSRVFAAERIYTDDTAGLVLAKGNTRTGGSGPMCATTPRLLAQIRRRPCSSTRWIVAVSIRRSIWWAMPDGCGPMPVPASAGSPHRVADGRINRPCAPAQSLPI